VNDFVEKCRRERRRLRVPDAVANEMAADLEADLAEAEADGTSPEEVLGNGCGVPKLGSHPRKIAICRGTLI
jgi:hypothetical protein